MTSSEKTLSHMRRVSDLMVSAAFELIRRGKVHDASKFAPEEAGPLAKLDALIAREGNLRFGSAANEVRTAFLAPMLAHHYAHNSHHPEHYPEGVAGMDLFDLIEMFMDWKAASERDEQSTMNLAVACERFKLNEQLCAILQNTADRLGWPT